MTDTALRVVLNVKEVDQLTKLRKENAELRKELTLWRGTTKLPFKGAYYATDNNLLEDHGWDFELHRVAMRYEGVEEWTKIYNNNAPPLTPYRRTFIDHIFTLPYKYEEWGDQFNDKGFIKMRLATYELHRLMLIEPDEETLYDRVDENDVQRLSTSS